MSFTVQPAGPARPNRCQLFGPATRPTIFEKMAASAADVINIDLEDSVAPADKAAARTTAIEAVNDVDWGAKTLSVRINGLDTGFWHHDVIDLIEKTGDRLDLIMIPKVGNAKDIYAVDALVSACEQAARKSKRIGFEVLIETAAGAQNVGEIAAASPRIQSMSFGVADYAASMGMNVTGIGGTQDDYHMLANDEGRTVNMVDPWHYPIARMVAACRQHGVLPVDGPFGDFSDDEGFLAQAKRSATLGCVGKWAIHPKQVALANRVFTPTPAKVEHARRILAAMRAAEEGGQGAAVLDGKLIDLASSRQARVIVTQAELIEAAGG
ncbi:CoA ester lyase [Pikeienuella piscinae]|uniref:CoA ester lyase n=1 Tax=Pikeienuella piscinae TaxID=2748098 RepID=A0A7L5BZ90_9RHOB|nr:CoA ester lyase [Pikeienuella piscinae]QIE55576.1 CoA ester lyase [Pikeienuella piscinae]